MKFEDLTNEELLTIYYRFKKHTEGVDKNLEKNMIVKSIDTPIGFANAITQIDEEQKQKIINSDYYKTSKSIVVKLQPLIELIEERDEMKEFAQKIK